MRREVNELGVVTRAIEDTHRANLGALDDGEAQAGAQREGPVDPDGNDTAGAIVGFVQGEARIGVERADVAGALFADETALAVVGRPGVELLAVPLRRPRPSIGPGVSGAVGWVFDDGVCVLGVLLGVA